MNKEVGPLYPRLLKCSQVSRINGVEERAKIKVKGKESLSIELIADFPKLEDLVHNRYIVTSQKKTSQWHYSQEDKNTKPEKKQHKL